MAMLHAITDLLLLYHSKELAYYYDHVHDLDMEELPDEVIRCLNDFVKKNNIKLNKGDIIDFEGERSTYYTFWTGDKLINVESDLNEYGNIPKFFNILEEFSPSHWDGTRVHSWLIHIKPETLLKSTFKTYNVKNVLYTIEYNGYKGIVVVEKTKKNKKDYFIDLETVKEKIKNGMYYVSIDAEYAYDYNISEDDYDEDSDFFVILKEEEEEEEEKPNNDVVYSKHEYKYNFVTFEEHVKIFGYYLFDIHFTTKKPFNKTIDGKDLKYQDGIITRDIIHTRSINKFIKNLHLLFFDKNFAHNHIIFTNDSHRVNHMNILDKHTGDPIVWTLNQLLKDNILTTEKYNLEDIDIEIYYRNSPLSYNFHNTRNNKSSVANVVYSSNDILINFGEWKKGVINTDNILSLPIDSGTLIISANIKDKISISDIVHADVKYFISTENANKELEQISYKPLNYDVMVNNSSSSASASSTTALVVKQKCGVFNCECNAKYVIDGNQYFCGRHIGSRKSRSTAI